MRVRHRIPSIFNLSMVDVLCCALGCVILLWLLNLREAKDHEDTTSALLRAARTESDKTNALLESARTDRDNAYGMLFDLNNQLKSSEDEKADLQKKLNAQRATARSLEQKLKDSAARIAALENDLGTSERRGRDTAAKLKEVQGVADLVPRLRQDLKKAQAEYAAERAMASALEKEVTRRSQEMKDRDESLQSLRTAKTKLQTQLNAYQSALAETNRSVETLKDENKKLSAETLRVKTALENRFEGIALTGRRIVFMVDMSGSMKLVEENKEAPTKWRDVYQTVGRLMRSLPDLEKFQVIVFADKSRFLLGDDGAWLPFDPKTTPDRVMKELAKVDPAGGTNMYDAFQAVFRLRPLGLDTIYLLSDGLPNLGEGLPKGQELTDAQRETVLANYIRNKLRQEWNRSGGGVSQVRINTIGFFYESPNVGAFLWALARENDGSFVGMSKP
jgi:hypothetical protein